jgi:hypothetical protein
MSSMISSCESDGCSLVPKLCSQSLKANPFETYRDPVTGRWITVTPEPIAASTQFEPVQFTSVQFASVQGVKSRKAGLINLKAIAAESSSTTQTQSSPIASQFQRMRHLQRLKFQRSSLQQVQQGVLSDLQTHFEWNTKSSSDLSQSQWSQPER